MTAWKRKDGNLPDRVENMASDGLRGALDAKSSEGMMVRMFGKRARRAATPWGLLVLPTVILLLIARTGKREWTEAL